MRVPVVSAICHAKHRAAVMKAVADASCKAK
jgi:hypothetical protein